VMIGILNSGQTVAKDTIVYLSKWTPPVTNNEAMRFKVNYEFNNSKSINIYKQYLTKVIVPNISHDATVVIHGHSENIRYTDYNLELMLSRVNDVREIIEKELAKANRTDVKFLVYGFGKDQVIAPFGNANQIDRF
jgi:outer membrane protein OmpA-like peptidoglycan-associated protein